MRKKIIAIIVLFISLLIIRTGTILATYSANNKTVTSGGTVTITVTSSNALQNYDISLNNSGGLNYNGCSANPDNGLAEVNSKGGKISYMSTGAGTSTLGSFSFKAPSVTTDQTYTVSFIVNGQTVNSTVTVTAPSAPSTPSNNNEDDDNLPTASNGGTTTTVKSSNNYLKSLSLSTGSISFNRKTTKYTVNVPENTESITVTGTAEHAKATVQGNGAVNLKKGSNTINIVVTAENGSARTYTITVVRAGETETKSEEENEPNSENVQGLTSLNLKGVKDNGEIVEILLTPEFSEDVFYYECEIPEGVNFIDVENQCDILDAIVEVTGNENLVEGENLINIIVKYTDENGEEQTITYQISAKKQALEVTQEVVEEKNGLSPLQIGIIAGSVGIAIVIIIVLMVKYRKQQNRENMDFGGYGEPFYSEEEEKEIFEEPMNISNEEEKEPEITQEEKIRQEQLDNWDDFEPVKRKKVFGKNAKKGKHF